MFGGSGRHVHSGRWHGHRSYGTASKSAGRPGGRLHARPATASVGGRPDSGFHKRMLPWAPAGATLSWARTTGTAVAPHAAVPPRRMTATRRLLDHLNHHDPLRESRRDQRDDG